MSETPNQNEEAPDKNPTTPQVTDVTCSVDLFNEILMLLQNLPYRQVEGLMVKIKTGFRAVTVNPSA